MIEHAWAPVTRCLSQLVTKDTLPGEDIPPLQQKLPSHVLREKEVRLFNLGAADIKGCLTGRMYDGHPVVCDPVQSDGDGSQFYQVKDIINIFANTGRRGIEINPGLAGIHKEVQLLSRHCAQGLYSLEFMRCTFPECVHCSSLGEGRSPKTMR